MSSIPVVKVQSDDRRSRRRQSSIPPSTPRPTSVLTHSANKPLLSTPTSTSSTNLQTSSPTVRTRTYSQAQVPWSPSQKPTPLSSHESSRNLVPGSDSLLPYNQRPAGYDLSGIRQQLHIRNYSTQLLASIETGQSSNKNGPSTSVTIPALRRLPKSKTSTSLAKRSPNLTPQRQLMKPIDPPLPRSQTMGNISCFVGDGTKETPSPLKSGFSSLNPSSSKQLGFMDVLQESRMTDHEVEVYKQVTRETQMNKHRMRRTGNTAKPHAVKEARECSDSYSTTTILIPPHAEILRSRRASKRFGKINVTKNEEMDLKLLRRDKPHKKDDRRLPMDGTISGALSVDTNLPNLPNQFQQTPGSLRMSDSEMIIESHPDEEWEVDVKLVHFHQEITYWTGRFSSLSDHLKTASAHLISSNFGAAVGSPNFQDMFDVEEPFEIIECRRTEYVLRELRSYCQTNAALSSFEEFEVQLRRRLEKRAEVQRKLAQGPITRRAEEAIAGHKVKSDFKPKLVWHFGQSLTSTIAGKAVATVGATTRKQAPMMIKSKTTSNLASFLDRGNDITATLNANTSGMNDAKSLPGLTWQRPTVHEAQAQAKRVREERVFAKAVVYRRVSGRDGGGGKGPTYKTVSRHDSGVGKVLNGSGDGSATNSEELVGGGFSQGWQGAEPPSSDGKPASKGGHSRKSSGADSLSLRKVLSDSMNGMRKIKRSFTGSGSVSGSERAID